MKDTGIPQPLQIYKVIAPLPKRLHNGRFTSETETAVRRFQKRNRHLDPEVVKNARWNF
jgi:hypothetical protein